RHFLARPRPIEAGELSDDERRRADDCLGNVFDFHGERHFVGEDIDWDHNPGSDHWVHDLNRFSFLDLLVRATLATGDDAYARKAAALVTDWVAKNDVCRSWFWRAGTEMADVPNGAWRSYLNIAIHLRAWTAVLEELVRFWTPAELLAVLKSVHDQLGYLEGIIPTATNNWIVIGADGMMLSAVRLPELRDRQRFIDYAWEKVLAEADRQVLPDGVQFELTQSYHGVVERLFLSVMDTCREAQADVPEKMESVTARMLDYTMQTVTPDGLQVAFNDSDPEQGAAARARLQREGRRRGRADWLYVGTAGAEGEPPGVLSQAFEHGGVYVMRTGWGPRDTFLTFDGGPWGYSHQHDDRLGFWLAALGRSFLIDPGRYLYDDNNPFSRRKYLNTTRAHSTISVDGEDQADRFFRPTWEPRERITDNTWIVTDEFQRVAGSHKLGYGENGRIRVEHRRCITFWPPDVILVLDLLTGDGEHQICSRLQFCPGDVECTEGVWRTTFPDANLAVLPIVDGPFEASAVTGRLDPTAGWYSPGVNRIEPSPSLQVHAEGELPLRAGFLLVPFRGAGPPAMAVGLEGDTVRIQAGDREYLLGFAEAMR
ncbi:MAG: alginate lyase family protein, partial [Planctomycetota bacterium]